MRYLVTVAICVLYFAGVLASAPLVGPSTAWALIAGWSAAFVWCYLAFLHGRASTAVSVVVVVTIVLPLVALMAIAWPNFDFLWPAFQDRGVFGALEFFAPLIAALICVLVAHRYRDRSLSMKPFTRIAVAVFALVTVVHLLRLFAGWQVIVAGFVIPVWWSAFGVLIAGGLALMVWREARA